MTLNILTKSELATRKKWVESLKKTSENFSTDSNDIALALHQEVTKFGVAYLVGHLRLCGAIPESYGHDSSEEKLYSKYTDVLIHEAFKKLGFASLVLKERADAADVECVGEHYSFVADAKAFRLSRTAKNQKDFKVNAMDRWKYGKPYAIIVCPIYQLPSRSSQIYHQSAVRSVFISTYTHLSVFVKYADLAGANKAQDLLLSCFSAVERLNPTKNASYYWDTVNRCILSFDDTLKSIWLEEKAALSESIDIAKLEALMFYAQERERILKLTKEQAIDEVLKASKIQKKESAINRIANNGLIDVGV